MPTAQRIRRYMHLVSAGVLLLASTAFAENKTGTPEARELPKSGLLATSSISGASSTIIGDTFGGEDLFGKELPPVTGSVSRRDDSTWTMSVSNNSQDRYFLNLDFIQKNEAGSSVKFGSYSYLLKPGQTERQSVQAGTNASRAELHLRSYRRIPAQQKSTDGSR